MSNESKKTSHSDEPGAPEPPPASADKNKKPSRPLPVRRQDILVLLSIWGVGCAVVASLLGLFYFYSSNGGPGQPTPNPEAVFNIPFSGGTAKTAYLSALNKAQAWSSDVELVAASASWSNATPEDLGRVDLWDFSFFSDGHKRIFFNLVATDQPVTGRAHPFKLTRPPARINPAEWIIDSDEAVSIWLNNGGGAFLEAMPGNHVEALLRQSANDGKPVWNIVGTSADQSQMFFLTIDAATGTVLN